MADTLGIFDAKARFSELVDRAAGGEEIIITKRGAAVARLGPATPQPIRSAEERRRIIEEMRALREGIAARGVTVTQAEIKEWINEGRA